MFPHCSGNRVSARGESGCGSYPPWATPYRRWAPPQRGIRCPNRDSICLSAGRRTHQGRSLVRLAPLRAVRSAWAAPAHRGTGPSDGRPQPRRFSPRPRNSRNIYRKSCRVCRRICVRWCREPILCCRPTNNPYADRTSPLRRSMSAGHLTNRHGNRGCSIRLRHRS